MADRAQIDATYQADMREAEAYTETDAQKASDLRTAAERRRADGYQELHRESELAGVRAAALTEFPEADSRAVVGSTPEEIKANAKASHEFVTGKVTAAVDAARGQSRVELTKQWGGSQPNAPRGEIVGGGTTAERTAQQIEKEKRDAAERGDVKQVIKLRREQGGLTGLDAMAQSQVSRAREETGTTGKAPTAQELEDRRG